MDYWTGVWKVKEPVEETQNDNKEMQNNLIETQKWSQKHMQQPQGCKMTTKRHETIRERHKKDTQSINYKETKWLPGFI